MKLQMKPDIRSPRVTTPLAPPLRPPPRPPPPPSLHPHCPDFPPPAGPFSRRGCFSSASRSPTRHFCFPFFVASLTLTHMTLTHITVPLVAVFEKVVSRLVSTTIVLRVAPPAVVVRLLSVLFKYMPGLELVEPRGCSLLRPGRGRGRACLSPGGRTLC